MQGLYIYRNDRLIQYGNWQGMFGDVNGTTSMRNSEKFSWTFLDHIKLFGLNPTKTGVVPKRIPSSLA